MRSSWPTRFLPLLQVLAEGGWIAVVYAAAQVQGEEPPHIGPLELALMAGIGMRWARRSGWREPAPEAIGLPLLALAGGAFGWFLDPGVRTALVNGDLLAAASMHLPGWLAGVAVIRGAAHADPDDDEEHQDRLLRWIVPGLALPWLAGQAIAPRDMRQVFTDAAFIGTLIFIASAFAAMGLARLEAVRVATGSDWQRNRTWLAVLGVAALAMAVIGIPAGALLGVPLQTLLVTVYGPIRLVVLAFLLLLTPVLLLAALVVEALRAIIPKGVTLPTIKLPNLGANPIPPDNVAPAIIFYVVVGLLILVEVAIVAAIIYLRWQERRKFARALVEGFEERSIVIPAPVDLPQAPRTVRHRRPARRSGDPAGVYLAALDALAADGRWSRRPEETPGAHARRARAMGLADASLARLAVAYQLVRYAGRTLSPAEASRAPGRLGRLLNTLRR